LNFEELARQTAQELFDGTAVIFLGAGASMGDDSERAVGKGVPGSVALTEAIAKQFGIELKYDGDGNLLSRLRPVASLAVQKRDPSTVKRFVIDQIRPRCGVPLKVHKALARVNPHTVITTNYDDLYEAAARKADQLLEKVVSPEQLARLPQLRPRLLKLHGDLEAPEKIVLTRQDYGKWQREAGGFSRRWTPCGSASPMASAICQPFLRSTLPSKPTKYRLTRSLASERANRPAIRACNSSNLSDHWPTALGCSVIPSRTTIPSLPRLTGRVADERPN
jgi:hypothetical protein